MFQIIKINLMDRKDIKILKGNINNLSEAQLRLELEKAYYDTQTSYFSTKIADNSFQITKEGVNSKDGYLIKII